MKKQALIAFILLLPCVLAFNGNEDALFINAIGIIYSVCLYVCSRQNKRLKTAYLNLYKVSYKILITLI